MFRREVDGETLRFSVAGLWGSGNVVANRDGWIGLTEETGWTMWDGHALYGPGRPGRLERYPVLLATLPLSTVLERYRDLDVGCRVWTGRETLGIGCEAACDALEAVCGEDREACLEECGGWPRAIAGCFAAATTCDAEDRCGRSAWRDRAR